MYILISNSSDIPIYEQIVKQIKEKIMTGELSSGASLPSIRGLAQDLRISVITTKRAFEELEKDGYIETVASKGSFVSGKNRELIKEDVLKNIESHILAIVESAKKVEINKKEIKKLIDIFYEENEK